MQNVTLTRTEPADYSKIDVSIESVEVKLSLRKYLEGAGLVEEMYIKGVRGEVNLRDVYWDPEVEYPKQTWSSGDYDLKKLHLEDVDVDFYFPNIERALTLSLFQFDCTRFRRQWLLFDALTANYIHGSFDNCLFNFQKMHEIEDHCVGEKCSSEVQTAGEGGKRLDRNFVVVNRLKLDGLNVDLLTAGLSGPLSWITSGYV